MGCLDSSLRCAPFRMTWAGSARLLAPYRGTGRASGIPRSLCRFVWASLVRAPFVLRKGDPDISTACGGNRVIGVGIFLAHILC